MHIPQDIIRNILDTANIRQVVEEFVPLKKTGRNWMGLCPFHADRDPSFSVNEERGIFYCFGCGQGGDAIGFLMKMQGLSFVGAVRRLADRYGIALPESAPSLSEMKLRRESEELIMANRVAARFYQDNLVRSKDALHALEYLKKRGISSDIAARFGLGYAGPGWNLLLNHLKSNGISPEVAEKAGLVVQREGGGHYDRFRNRLIFPIHDRSGEIVALGGRTLEKDGAPKYLNSPESLIYKKGRVLYGLYQNKDSIRRSGYGYVVEGYMDLLALVQAGIDNAVATLGTALTYDHIKQMKGLVKDWTLAFDGDEAGLKASLRAMPLFYGADIRPKVLSMPAEDDPDTFVRREGKNGWIKAAQSSPAGIDFVMAHGIRSYGTDPEGKARLIDDLISILKPIEDPVKKSLLAGYIAQKMAVREEALWKRLASEDQAYANKDRAHHNLLIGRDLVPHQRPDGRNLNKADAKLIGFLIEHPQYIDHFIDSGMELWIKEQRLKDLWLSMLQQNNATGGLDFHGLMEMLEPVPELKVVAVEVSKCSPPCQDAEEMAKKLKKYCENRKIKALRQLIINEIENSDNEEERQKLLEKMQRLR
ncbi:MAG: DNA primase [Dissulfurimicrobium sp.]|uniref:DNA primase n=1 Tax=Dissulfurimicrobium TaxID=1769732 RepID=UPI001EDA0B35|nr:DNA primase [Dissulfurimicrobium hydrothermale]UKL14509.1 DNA primase [Dissulfurimicrobium hydrothermale]